VCRDHQRGVPRFGGRQQQHGTRQCYALRLPARQLTRLALGEVVHVQCSQGGVVVLSVLRLARGPLRNCQVLVDAECRAEMKYFG
jgi:hypothetical protein